MFSGHLPKAGDSINIPATVIAVDEANKIIFVKAKEAPAEKGSTQGTGEGGFAVMWGT